MIRLGHRVVAPGQGHAAGRQLLQQMYEEYTGCAMPAIALAAQGKPYFTEGTLHFSISHTRHHVFCALSDKPIGIDAEEQDRSIDLRLAQKILSPSEKQRWETAPDPRLALLRLWVLKEAAAKLAGTGLQGYPRHTDFSPEDPRITETENCLLAVITEEHYAV